MSAGEYYAALRSALAGRTDIDIGSHQLEYSSHAFEFLRIASKDISDNDRIILIRGGIHGDEISGPMTVLLRAGQIIDAVHGAGLKLIVYPMGNPSGFEAGTRYNADGDRGTAGNNDFLRYRLSDGSVVDCLANGVEPAEWMWSSDPALGIRLPAETALMHALMKADPLDRVVAALDLHQDAISKSGPAAYQYVYNEPSSYASILERIDALVPLLRHTKIEAGMPYASMSDAAGSIISHDGSLSDLLFRHGVRHSITTETTIATPLEHAIEVNMLWLRGMIDIVNHENT